MQRRVPITDYGYYHNLHDKNHHTTNHHYHCYAPPSEGKIGSPMPWFTLFPPLPLLFIFLFPFLFYSTPVPCADLAGFGLSTECEAEWEYYASLHGPLLNTLPPLRCVHGTHIHAHRKADPSHGSIPQLKLNAVVSKMNSPRFANVPEAKRKAPSLPLPTKTPLGGKLSAKRRS